MRDEIVNPLSTLMMVHTLTPTPEDYNTVCAKLIMAYPVLKDTCDNGYVRACSFWLVVIHMYFIRNHGRKSFAWNSKTSDAPPDQKKLVLI